MVKTVGHIQNVKNKVDVYAGRVCYEGNGGTSGLGPIDELYHTRCRLKVPSEFAKQLFLAVEQTISILVGQFREKYFEYYLRRLASKLGIEQSFVEFLSIFIEYVAQSREM